MISAALAASAMIGAWAPPRTVGAGWGINLGFNDIAPREKLLMSQTGMKWVRRDLFWHVVEPQKGKWDWAIYDRLLKDLKELGMKPVFILCYGNGLYQADSPRSPEARAGFVRYVREAVRRYRGQGVIWEMWNEPNNHHWPPGPDVRQYISLATEVGKAFREVGPKEVLVGPGLAGFDWPFIEDCFKAGLLKWWDGVTVHPYRPMEPETAGEDYARLRDMIRRYAPAGKSIPILSGEWGYADNNTQGEDRQADWMVRQYLVNLANQVNLSIWYNWSENGPDQNNAEHQFGIVGEAPEFREKPAFQAVKGLTKVLGGWSYSKRLALGSSSDWILLFEKGARQGAVAWTTAKDGAPLPGRFWQGKGVRFFGRDGKAISLPKRLSTSPIMAIFPEGTLSRWAKVPELPLALSVASPRELNECLRPLWGRAAALASGSSAWSVVLGKDSASSLSRLPRFSDRSGSVHRLKVTVDGAPQEILLKHSAPIEADLTPSPAGQNLILTARTLPFSGKLEVDQGGSKTLLDLILAPGPPKKIALPDRPGPIRITLTERGRVVRREGPLELVKLSVKGASTRVEGDPNATGAAAFVVKSDQAGGLEFDFGKGWKYGLLQPPAPVSLPGRPLRFSVMVTGDGSGAVLLMRYVDKSGQTFQPEGIPVDWKGPRLVSFPLDGSTGGRWGGANDGIQRLPLAVSALAVVDNPRGAGVKGRLQLSNPVVLTRLN